MQNFELKESELSNAVKEIKDYRGYGLEDFYGLKMKLQKKILEGKQPWGDNLNTFKKAYESGEKICNLVDNFQVEELSIKDQYGMGEYITAHYNRKDRINHEKLRDGVMTKHPYFFVYCNNPPPKKITGLLNGMNTSKVLPPSSMFGSMLGQRPKSPLFGIGGRRKTRRGRKHRRRSTHRNH
jgi:hypothetical protein